MKSILIIQPWISYRGAESVSIEEAKNYERHGIKASILCGWVDWKRIKKEDRNIDYIVSPLIFFQLLIKGRKYEVLNPHNFPTLWMAALANCFLKKKIVWRVHNFPQVWFKNGILNQIWEKISFPIDNWAAHKTDKILVVSEKVKKQVKSLYNLESRVVYPVIDRKFFAMKRNVARDPNLVLIPAKITAAKSFDLATKVIAKVNKTSPKIRWAIAGEGTLKQVPKNVKILGWQSKEDMARWYQKASLIFLPGYWGEGFNITVLEGQAGGTPSLVIEGSGVDTYLKKSKLGIVCEPDTDKITTEIVNFFHK